MRRRIASASHTITTTVMITGTITIMRTEGRTTNITPMAIRIATPASNTITSMSTITGMRTSMPTAPATGTAATTSTRIPVAATMTCMSMTNATMPSATTVTTAWVRRASPCRV